MAVKVQPEAPESPTRDVEGREDPAEGQSTGRGFIPWVGAGLIHCGPYTILCLYSLSPSLNEQTLLSVFSTHSFRPSLRLRVGALAPKVRRRVSGFHRMRRRHYRHRCPRLHRAGMSPESVHHVPGTAWVHGSAAQRRCTAWPRGRVLHGWGGLGSGGHMQTLQLT